MTTGADREVLVRSIEDVTYRSGCVEAPGSRLREWLTSHGWSVRTWTDRPGTDHPPHDHSYSHRVLCASGWIEFTVRSESFRLERGGALDLPEGVTHSARTSPEEPTEYWLLQPR